MREAPEATAWFNFKFFPLRPCFFFLFSWSPVSLELTLLSNHLQIILDVPTVGGRLMLVDMAGSENIEQAGQIGFEAKMQVDLCKYDSYFSSAYSFEYSFL